MADDVTLEILSSSIGGSSGGGTDGGPARLMPADSRTELDADDYPEVTADVAVESGSGSVGDVAREHFAVEEDGDEREVLSLEFVNDALDLAFVFDDTGSMGGEIDGAKAGVTDLTDAIDGRDVDARYALVTFKDDVEVDQRFTDRADSLKSSVDRLRATGGGDAPEANFDAIERALDLNWRPDAQQVVVDITDAPSHYRGDGSGYSSYTFDEVARDLDRAGVTFISVAPDSENRTSSVKSLTGEVGGLWTDIAGLRSGVSGFLSGSGTAENFQRVLDRITSLVASTYVLTYFSCTPPGTRATTRITFDHPGHATAADTASIAVPGRFELPEDCEESPAVSPVDTGETDEPADDAPSVTRVDDAEAVQPTSTDTGADDGEADDGGAPGVARVDDEPEDATDVAVIPDSDAVEVGEPLTVTVRDERGDRLEGATVRTPSGTATTDGRGTATVEFAEPGEGTVEATKEADDETYATATATVTVREP